ncbi:hypothetical protein ACFX2A_026060 [Malus domestica]
MANLFRQKLAHSPLCPICHITEETTEHLLLKCPWVEALWFRGALNSKVNRADVSCWWQWFEDLLRSDQWATQERKWLLAYVGFTCWRIWKTRCNFIIKHSTINLAQTLFVVNNDVGVFFAARKLDWDQ